MNFLTRIFRKPIFLKFNTLENSEKYNYSKKTIVFISSQIPTYDKDSGSNRLKEIINVYLELNYNCIMIVDKINFNEKHYNFFLELGVVICEINKNKNQKISFLKTIPKVDFIWYNGPNSLKKNYSIVSKALPISRALYDMVDIHFLRYKRAIKLNPIRISLRKKYNKYFNIETKLAQKADYIIAISDVEKEIMSQYIDANKLITISNVHYPKVKKEDTLNFEERANILFIGSSHTPNIDALYYLCNEIMPIVWKKSPKIKVNIIGNVNHEISDISHPNITFLGYVPDIESLFKSSKMMVAPLRYGAGVKGKIGQAFEYYLPVITSSIGAEGMNLIHNENLLVEDTKEGFANAIINLYTDKMLWLKLQNNSENSLEPFSKEKVKSVISKL